MDVSELLSATKSAFETAKEKAEIRDSAAQALQAAQQDLESAQDVLEGYRLLVNEILSAAMPQADSKVRIG